MIGKIPSGTETRYWLASRSFIYNSSSDWYFYGRRVDPDGSLDDNWLYHYNSGFSDNFPANAIRPVVTLKSSIGIKSGDGTSAKTAYQLS